MCLLVFAWQPGTEQPLVLLANRDEFLARPSAPLAAWPDQPQIVAGRDLDAQGTWLGVNSQGSVAALTNIRDLNLAEGPRSRGQLVSDFLQAQLSPEHYLQQVVAERGLYSGFNLLLGNRQQLWFFNSTQIKPQRLSPGIYALCNASLDTPWPKLVRLRTAFSACYRTASDQQLLALMQDSQRAEDEFLPDTGVGLTAERLLSSVFIRGEHYGTRATTLVRLLSSECQITEQTYLTEGQRPAPVQFRLPLD